MKLLTGLVCLLVGLATIGAPTAYPDLWWKPVTDKVVPGWEILPQAAARDKNEVIISKRNELGVMSNFAAAPFTMLKTKYASVEGLWQSMKFPEDEKDQRMIVSQAWSPKRADVEALTAFDALKAGKAAEAIMKDKSITWVSFHGNKIEYKGQHADAYYEIIEAATRAKIDENPDVKRVLLATGDLKLRPDHHEDKDGTKAWKYYDIYMKLRKELQQNPSKKLYNEDWYKDFAKKYKLTSIH
jgi:predicted NAD-dependent protein-ADP-ribosyltransferase YbiA (DUF1768 family)